GANGVAVAMTLSPALRVLFLVGSMSPRLTSYGMRNRLVRRLLGLTAAAVLSVLLAVEVGSFIDSHGVQTLVKLVVSGTTYTALVLTGRMVTPRDLHVLLGHRLVGRRRRETHRSAA